MQINFTPYNQALQGFGTRGLSLLKSNAKNLGIAHRDNSNSPGDSVNRMRVKFNTDAQGAINRISFTQINRSLIYAMYGAGKGRGGRVGSRWTNSNGIAKTTDPKSLGKMGTSGRKAKPFISQFLDGSEGVDKLADIVAEQNADLIVSNIFIK